MNEKPDTLPGCGYSRTSTIDKSHIHICSWHGKYQMDLDHGCGTCGNGFNTNPLGPSPLVGPIPPEPCPFCDKPMKVTDTNKVITGRDGKELRLGVVWECRNKKCDWPGLGGIQ